MKLKLLFTILLFRICSPGFAQWKSSCSAINTPVCDTINSQGGNQMINDGRSGAIIGWFDGRDTTLTPFKDNLYCQKIDYNGFTLWPKNGVPVPGTYSLQSDFQLVSDGQGGVIVVFVTQDTGPYTKAQRLDANGHALWGPTGIFIFNFYAGGKIEAVSDGNGGAIIISASGWDTTTSQNEIIAQRIDKNGNLLWPAYHPVGATMYWDTDYDVYHMIAAEEGGAIITWEQNDIPGGQADFNIYAQKLDSNGVLKWGNSGVVVCNDHSNPYSDQFNPVICSDRNNGCFVSWLDYRSQPKSYLQHLDKYGNPLLAFNGIIIDTLFDYPYIISDIDSGAFLFHFEPNYDRTLQCSELKKIDYSGNVRWTKPVTSYSGYLFYVKNYVFKSDDHGGLFISWDENNFGAQSIVAQHLDRNGDPLWGPGGVIVSNPSGETYNAHFTTDTLGGIILAWDDDRNYAGINTGDIYAQRIQADGTLDGPDGLFQSISADTTVLVNSTSTYIRISGSICPITWQYSPDGIHFTDAIIPDRQRDTFLLVDNLTDTMYYRGLMIEPNACTDTTGIIKVTPYPRLLSDYVLCPNPFTDYAHLFINSSIDVDQAEVRIYDFTGREVFARSGIENHEILIQKEGLARGVYVYRLWNHQAVFGTGKFFIK